MNDSSTSERVRDFPGYVYVVESAGRYKIGRTRHPERRIEEIEAGSPLPVRPVFVVRDPDAPQAENILHRLFAHARSHGEWFDLTPDELADACSLLAGGELYV